MFTQVLASAKLAKAEMVRKMTTSDSLSGLMKWLAKEPWRSAFLEVLNHHTGPILEEYDIPDFDEFGGLIGADYAMTLWGCAFEDFLTRDVEGAGEYCRRLSQAPWLERVCRQQGVHGRPQRLGDEPL